MARILILLPQYFAVKSVYLSVCLSIYKVCIFMYVCVCMYVCMYVCNMYVCVCVCVCVCARARAQMLSNLLNTDLYKKKYHILDILKLYIV